MRRQVLLRIALLSASRSNHYWEKFSCIGRERNSGVTWRWWGCKGRDRTWGRAKGRLFNRDILHLDPGEFSHVRLWNTRRSIQFYNSNKRNKTYSEINVSL